MNYLAHLYLSGENEGVQVGNLMGDFVKGRLHGAFPVAIEQGIAQHRSVDSFARSHPVFQTSWQRLSPKIRHIRPLLIDLFYDHFLAKNWPRLHPLPLQHFAEKAYLNLEQHWVWLPATMRPMARRMIDRDWLCRYAEIETIDLALERMSSRFRRKVDLTVGSDQLRQHFEPLQNDFFHFIDDAAQLKKPL